MRDRITTLLEGDSAGEIRRREVRMTGTMVYQGPAGIYHHGRVVSAVVKGDMISVAYSYEENEGVISATSMQRRAGLRGDGWTRRLAVEPRRRVWAS